MEHSRHRYVTFTESLRISHDLKYWDGHSRITCSSLLLWTALFKWMPGRVMSQLTSRYGSLRIMLLNDFTFLPKASKKVTIQDELHAYQCRKATVKSDRCFPRWECAQSCSMSVSRGADLSDVNAFDRFMSVVRTVRVILHLEPI